MLSFWEQESLLHFDYAIIGSGIVGLSAAISIKQANVKARVAVFEKGMLPTGASTKNAGFACFGSVTEILDDLESMPESKVLELVEMRWKGLEILRTRLRKNKLDYHGYGGYELIGDNEIYAIDKIDYVNGLLQPIFKQSVFALADDKLAEFGFNKQKVKHLIYNPLEGQLQPGLMMRNLIELANLLGVQIFTNSPIVSFNDSHSGVELLSEKGIVFKAQKLAICTNAFTQQLIPEIGLKPGRGQVIVTKPIANLPFKGVFHFDAGYYYFRNYGDRIVFGGGRNLDFKGEATTVFENTDLIIHELKKLLAENILPNREFEVDYQWAGIMAFGENKYPICQKISDNVVIGVRLGGMGVAIGSYLGKKIEEILASK